MVNPNDVLVNGIRVSNLFSTQDEGWHSRSIKPVGTHYTMARVLDIEVHVDNMLTDFTRILTERFVEKKESLDIAEWTKYFAWDSMRNLTFGKPYGLMESGEDKGSVIETSTRGLEYYAPVSQLPQLDFLLDKNPIHRIGPPPLLWATILAYSAVAERKAENKEEAISRQSDFLDKFLEISKQNPDVVDDNMVVTYLLSNVLAGSDTTAIYMCAALYYLLKNPDCLARVRRELDPAKIQTPVSYRTASELPYFDAAMKEAQRMHPGVGIMVERVVPAGGFALPDGRFLPAGTVVGMNPWVMNRVEKTYGPNTDKFIPERWLPQPGESEQAYQERAQNMKKADFTFGAGSRVCIGRNLAIMQAYKMVATLLTRFNVELVDKDREWKVNNCWFTYVYDVPMKISLRTLA